jgi:lipid A ethanolaminephosphotransferase
MLKRTVRPEVAVFCVAAYVLVVFNVAFWRKLFDAVAPDHLYEWLFLAAVFIEGLCILNLLFGLFAIRYVFKPVAAVLLLVTAAAGYFVNGYGVVIDAHMVRNIFQTDRAEAADLLTAGLVFYLLIFGAIPAALLWIWPIQYRPFWKEVRFKAIAGLGASTIVAATAVPFIQDITSVFREHRILLPMFAPLNYLSAYTHYLRSQSKLTAARVAPFGEDARKVSSDHHRKSLTIIVIGETARAANFSLNGYGRPTNPLLGTVSELVNFSHAYSCGTDTAQSVPCMFSGLERTAYSYERAIQQEGLLDILQRAGYAVLWRENQSGCKEVCKRIPTEFVTTMEYRKFYEIGSSLDENLLTGLREKIDQFKGDAVVVLHMMGSHGPAYYQRYPGEFEKFQPPCKESQFSRCTLREIVNSYDNSILYTDSILFRLVDLLRTEDRAGVATAMIYVSDHGESLGETGLYLHGLPYVLAPDVQKHVPMMFWLSPKFQADTRIDVACLQGHRDEAVSHDNFFHSVLGLLDVRTKVYRKELDLFTNCRGRSTTAEPSY